MSSDFPRRRPVESPVFVVGCPRSGTGLLRNLLRSHSQLAFPGESASLPALYRAYGDPRDEREARRLARRVLRLREVRAWSLCQTPDTLAHCRSFAQMMSELYGELAAREEKQRWGDKTPSYVREIPTLLEIFPGAKIVHIYRDGRDVALSWTAAALGPANVITAAERWKRLVLAARRAGMSFPGSYHEVRYEDLLADPERTMRAVCAFIGERFEAGVLRPTPLAVIPTRSPWVGSWPPNRVASRTELVPSNSGKWRRIMSRSERSVFEGMAGDLLDDLGYETEGNARYPGLPERRLAFAHSSARTFLRRLNSREASVRTFLTVQEARLRRKLGRAAGGRPATPA